LSGQHDFQFRLEKEWGLERGLVHTIFEPCSNVLAACLEGFTPLRRVLDVGCGSGIAGRTIAARYPSLTRIDGLDLEQAALHVAMQQTKHDSRFHFRQADACAFDVKESYDAVIAQHLLHQLGDDGARAALACMYAALRPGGRLILGQWPELALCPAYAFIYTASGEYDEKNSDPVMTQARLGELIERVGGMRIIATSLSTDFRTPPVTPRDLLEQYFNGSQRWRQRDKAAWKTRLELPGLNDLVVARSRAMVVDASFGIGMLVVVAERAAA
jgi:SAM-dependent methyltransferase